MFSRSLTWWVEMRMTESSRVYFVTAFLNCAFEGMSRPFVGSSMNRYFVLHASAKAMYVFFSCPNDILFIFCCGSTSRTFITSLNLPMSNPVQNFP